MYVHFFTCPCTSTLPRKWLRKNSSI
jgi:hypothetical protein